MGLRKDEKILIKVGFRNALWICPKQVLKVSYYLENNTTLSDYSKA